jgi:hypothetical protein
MYVEPHDPDRPVMKDEDIEAVSEGLYDGLLAKPRHAERVLSLRGSCA